MLIGGIEALIMRIQLAPADRAILGPETYNQIFSIHGMTIIFWYASPILSGFGVYPCAVDDRRPRSGVPAFQCFTYWRSCSRSTTGGPINFIVTILHLRAPGMAISKMPLFLYSTLTVSFVTVFSLPSLTATNVFLELDRRWATHFFDVARR